MTVWVFGASGSHVIDNEPDQWPRHLANLLNTNVNSLALTGTSLDYMYQKFMEVRNDIAENDVILISVIGFEREWLFKDYPHKSMLFAPPNDDRRYKEAIEYYIRYLQSKELQELKLINFLYNLDYLSKQKNLKTILIIPYVDIGEFLNYKKDLFPHLHIAKGLLIEVSCNEIEKNILRRQQYINFDDDRRLNHLTRSNHIILSQKIHNWITQEIPVDLTEGFVENHYTDDAKKNTEFIKYELFNNAVDAIYTTVT